VRVADGAPHQSRITSAKAEQPLSDPIILKKDMGRVEIITYEIVRAIMKIICYSNAYSELELMKLQLHIIRPLLLNFGKAIKGNP
jgi:hypothetical protein